MKPSSSVCLLGLNLAQTSTWIFSFPLCTVMSTMHTLSAKGRGRVGALFITERGGKNKLPSYLGYLEHFKGAETFLEPLFPYAYSVGRLNVKWGPLQLSLYLPMTLARKKPPLTWRRWAECTCQNPVHLPPSPGLPGGWDEFFCFLPTRWAD